MNNFLPAFHQDKVNVFSSMGLPDWNEWQAQLFAYCKSEQLTLPSKFLPLVFFLKVNNIKDGSLGF